MRAETSPIDTKLFEEGTPIDAAAGRDARQALRVPIMKQPRTSEEVAEMLLTGKDDRRRGAACGASSDREVQKIKGCFSVGPPTVR